MNNRITPLTDDRGRMLLPSDELFEPLPGSVVLSEGLHGTAWQRRFNDGMWYSAMTGQRKAWEDMLRKRNLVLIYDAEPRPAGHGLGKQSNPTGAVWVQS